MIYIESIKIISALQGERGLLHFARRFQKEGKPMRRREIATSFDEQIRRIRLVTGSATEQELAGYLGVLPPEIEAARLCGEIPSDWLVILARVECVLPEWILTGRGECYAFDMTERYGTLGEDAAVRQADKEALTRLPPGMLAHELVRRIVMAEQNALARRTRKSPRQRKTGGQPPRNQDT